MKTETQITLTLDATECALLTAACAIYIGTERRGNPRSYDRALIARLRSIEGKIADALSETRQ